MTAVTAVLVTGAGGFAGSHLIEYLAGSGITPTGWIRSRPPEALTGAAAWQVVDLLDRDTVRRKVAELRPSIVYHCAGAPHVAQSWQDTSTPLQSNVLTTHYLFDALRRTGHACRVLVPGSAHLYAPSAGLLTEDARLAPASPYALSKLAQEQLALRAGAEDGVDVILTRSFNHTGPRQSAEFAAPGMARQIALIEQGVLEPIIKVGNLDAQRDMTDVRDTVRAYALLIERGTPGTIYNVASGLGRPIRDVLQGLVDRARVPVRIEIDPARFRPSDIPVLIGDASRLRSATGWRPAIAFDRMLDDLLDYWRATMRLSQP